MNYISEAAYRQPFKYFVYIKKSIDYAEKEKPQNPLKNQDFKALNYL
jgi:hypothetical protein